VPCWRRPWLLGENTGLPTNVVSGKKYQGCNNLLLSLAALEKGYESKWWATYPQWRSLGGQVRRGEKGTTIILYKPVRKVTITADGEEEVDSFPVMRTWTVFNIAQVDGDGLD
jgi:antirestriction protein ArdC